MADNLICKIVTPVKAVFSEEATYVGLPGEMGGFGVMKGHEPLVSGLAPGVVRVATPGAGKAGNVSFVVSGGYAEIKDNEVIVLADNAQSLSDVDVAAVRGELAKAEAALSSLAESDPARSYYQDQKDWLDLQLKSVSAAE